MAWISKATKASVMDKVLPQQPLAFIVCETEIKRVTQSLKEAFPANALHAFACKANQLKGVLEVMHKEGLGCETASIGEFSIAAKVFPDELIVFDSPVKTEEELRSTLYRKCYINIDNFQELDRVAKINAEKPIVATVGLRVNPQLGEGTIGQLSTGLATSKFGIGHDDYKDELIAAFRTHSFLSMLHVHTGSQGIGLKMMVEGVKKIVNLATTIGPAVKIVDIGGGLPVNFSSDEYTPTFSEYAAALRAEVPLLFDTERFLVITEFGRAVAAKAGILASRVEYVKVNGGRTILQQHIGADLAVRTVWAPQHWPLRVSIYDGKTGEERVMTEDNKVLCDVAGPCCLGGDLTAKERMLPQAYQDDIVVHKDVGGYYHSNYSLYNLRAMPACYLYDEDTDQLRLIRKAMTIDETIALMM